MKKTLSSILLCTALCATYTFAADALEEQVSAEEMAELFYKLGGDPKDPHRKVNHNKGFCATGEFVPSKEVTQQFNIPMLKHKSIPVLVRYSLGGGDPMKSDKDKGRGMAIRMNSGDGQHWELVNANTEIQFAKNPAEMKKFLEIRIPKEDGKPDMALIKKTTQEVESFSNFEKYLQKIGVTPNVANTTYHSIHAFILQNQKNQDVPARWKFVPKAGDKFLTDAELSKAGDHFLEKNFQESLKKGPVQYDMYFVLANKKDPIENINLTWQGKHKEVLAGTLKVKQFDGYACNPDVYMPSYLPDGIKPPTDPLFQLRNDTYLTTFGRRQ